MEEDQIRRRRCQQCRGTGLMDDPVSAWRSYNLYGDWASDCQVMCDACEGTRVECCLGCKTPDIDLYEAEAGRPWCTTCWIRESERIREETKRARALKLELERMERATADGEHWWDDLPF